MSTSPDPRRPVVEYGCAKCQRWHRQGIDPEYDAHLHRQAKHHYRADRPPTQAEALLRLRGEIAARLAAPN